MRSADLSGVDFIGSPGWFCSGFRAEAAKGFNVTEAGFSRFYKGRQRIYGALLIFVLAAGLPMAALPSLRGRLLERFEKLKAAAAGDVGPLSLNVGEYHEPFPAEFEKPAPPPSPPQESVIDKVYSMAPGVYSRPPAAAGKRPAPQIAKPAAPPPATVEITTPALPAASEAEPSGEAKLNYQTGTIEREAYELVLNSNSTIAGMVQGSNPALRFKSWDAAARGNDTYWVRIRFQSEGNPDVDYIWQVKLGAKQVTPLSYNARTLS